MVFGMPKIEDLGVDLKKLRIKARRMIENTVWYQENKKTLREKYSDKYVAIFNKDVIASDEDIDNLRAGLKEKGIDLDLVLIEFIYPKDMLMIF
jgi:hypothetical protein